MKCSASSFQWLSERISLARYAHVLWISDDGVPDLGGINEESTCFADEEKRFCGVKGGDFGDGSESYRMADILLIVGFEDIGSGSNVIDEQYGSDEPTSSAPALHVLKQLIQRCLSDAVTSGNVYGDAMLQHLYRWLCSPQSKLHDPALHRALHKVLDDDGLAAPGEIICPGDIYINKEYPIETRALKSAKD
ncbi:hypothetical protein K2173_004663 [Erythroxylum novogranatense]|uniref:DNA polymerase epsilon catalytic subunit n=1 Tax=Erythroxylum novogranatense TaxID=1862640 RepID=A0AAV8T685_9ROSI|nr:hypothetical protein K2173_004663 [Erythroxylum novogranatense]